MPIALGSDGPKADTAAGSLPEFAPYANLTQADIDNRDANGVPQICFIGVINPQNPRVETPQEVRADLLLASKYIPKERLGSTDDCGFSPFSIDEKPNHGSPDYAREVAFQKIANRVEGTRRAAEQLGVS